MWVCVGGMGVWGVGNGHMGVRGHIGGVWAYECVGICVGGMGVWAMGIWVVS